MESPISRPILQPFDLFSTSVHFKVELGLEMAADTAWNAATDRDVWRTLRPTAGVAVQ